MMRQALETLPIATRGRGFYDITRDVQARVGDARVQTGSGSIAAPRTPGRSSCTSSARARRRVPGAVLPNRRSFTFGPFKDDRGRSGW